MMSLGIQHRVMNLEGACIILGELLKRQHLPLGY